MLDKRIAIDRGPVRKTIEFATASDAKAFLDREEALWSWIAESPSHGYSQINNAAARYRPANWIQQFKNLLEQQKWNELEEAFRQRFSSEQRLCAADSEAQAVSVLGESNKSIGYVALATINGEAPLSDQNFMRDLLNRTAVAHGWAILSGVDSSIEEGATRALSQARGDIDVDAKRLRALIDQTARAAATSAEEINQAAQALGADHEADYTKVQTARREIFDKLVADLEAVTTAYEVRMQLQGPVRYWQKKSQRHRTAKWIAGSILVIYTIISVWALNSAFDHASMLLPATMGEHVPIAALFKAGTFALLTTSIAFWIGRVLLRIFLSNQHLATDADERMTMVMTFLALVRKRAVKDEDRSLILTPLFRAGADGIVKEDSAPDTALASFLAAMVKK